MNEVKIYNSEEFGNIRTVTIDNEPWFVGKDVATALGYADTFGALKKHIMDEDKLVCQIDSAGQKRDVTVINESGLYALSSGSSNMESRCILMEITRGKIQKAKKVVIYGPEGIGKSTFAARFPGAVFIDTEGSTNDMDVARLPRPTSWNMLFDEIEYIKTHTDECRTLVIDTIDWAELLCVEHICAVHNKKGIEDFGYGNGYVYTKEEFGRFLNKLSDLIEVGINVVLTAHAQLRKFEQPDELGAYDRWELKLGKKTQSQTSPLVKEWADMLLFANYKTFSVAVGKDGKKHKGQGGKRTMYTQHHPCEGVIRTDQEQFGSSWREISGRKNIMELIKKVWIYNRQRDEKDYPVTINF